MRPGKILIDSNILCSYLFQQNDWQNAANLFDSFDKKSCSLFITQFSLFSLSIISSNRNESDRWIQLLKYLYKNKEIHIIKTTENELQEIIQLEHALPLDFDDTLHYYYAKKLKCPIISFDTDFDKTDVTRIEPADLIEAWYSTNT